MLRRNEIKHTYNSANRLLYGRYLMNTLLGLVGKSYMYIVRQMGHCMGGNFNIHIWAWSASPSVQVGR